MRLDIHFIESIVQAITYKCFNINSPIDWATPIREYIKTGIDPQDKVEAKRIRRMYLKLYIPS